MLQILKQEDKTGYLEIISGLGLSERQAQISEAVDGENVTGFAVYEFLKDSIRIHMLSPDSDIVLLDGIIRSVLFLAVLKGIEKAEFLNDTFMPAVSLKILKSGERTLMPISEIFGGCKDCAANK